MDKLLAKLWKKQKNTKIKSGKKGDIAKWYYINEKDSKSLDRLSS